MRTSKRKILAVIGAGPKGLAVAVKAKVLEEFGIPVDRVVLIEKSGVAAHWSGEHGYTNGEMKLGTSPEKDVVFPVETDLGNSRLNQHIRSRLTHFTWTSFLIQTERYSDWVDRGRPAPCHQMWAVYLRWVSEQLAPHVSILSDELVQADLSSDETSWMLQLKGGEFIRADRLMFTGPGKTRAAFIEGEAPQGVYDIQSFWSALKERRFRPTGRVAVVGAGENAAAMLLALGKEAPHLSVDIIAPKGFVSTRAENFYENQVYSQPERIQWTDLQLADRIDFMERTDLGVFSEHAMHILNDQIRHRIVPGRVTGLTREQNALSVRIEYNSRFRDEHYDQLIVATGFDQIKLLKSILSPRALRALASVAPLETRGLAEQIQADLSVHGLRPALHLPMLAGLMHGPGFGNLSCLGRLSDRIVLTAQVETEFNQFQEALL